MLTYSLRALCSWSPETLPKVSPIIAISTFMKTRSKRYVPKIKKIQAIATSGP